MASFFKALDANFINFDANGSSPVLYKSSDLEITKEFYLPIPVSAGSSIKYQFTTSGGDISFCTKFVTGSNSDVVFSHTRVPSDVEPYAGQFKATRDGALLLHFDNQFSWFTPKYLSYTIELFQPAFAAADNARCLKSRSLLTATIEDTRKAESRLSTSRERMRELDDVILRLEHKLNYLSQELKNKKKVLETAYAEAEEMSARIDSNLQKKNGLCLRYVSQTSLS